MAYQTPVDGIVCTQTQMRGRR